MQKWQELNLKDFGTTTGVWHKHSYEYLILDKYFIDFVSIAIMENYC